MDSLQILKRLADDMKLIDIDKYPSESKVLQLESLVIQLAEHLSQARENRLKKLKEAGPRAYFNMGELNIVLLRPDEDEIEREVHYNFSERDVKVLYTEKESDRRLYRLTGPPDEEGRTYFIRANPMDYGLTPYGIYVSKEEATILRKAIREAEAKEYNDYW